MNVSSQQHAACMINKENQGLQLGCDDIYCKLSQAATQADDKNKTPCFNQQVNFKVYFKKQVDSSPLSAKLPARSINPELTFKNLKLDLNGEGYKNIKLILSNQHLDSQLEDQVSRGASSNRGLNSHASSAHTNTNCSKNNSAKYEKVETECDQRNNA